jgi:hypothetical protein
MEYTNVVSSPLVGISGGKLDKEVVRKVIEHLPLTSANKKRLKKLESLHGAGFWSDFGTGFKQGINDGLDVAGKVADVGMKVAPLIAMAGSGKKSELDKAKESLKKYVNRERKTLPSKKHLAILEKEGIISKSEGGNVFKDIGKGVSSAVKTTRKAVKNPAVKGAIMTGTSLVAPELAPLAGLALSAAGKAKKQPSAWIKFVLEFAKQNGLKYGDALKKAGPAYRKMKGGSYHMAV